VGRVGWQDNCTGPQGKKDVLMTLRAWSATPTEATLASTPLKDPTAETLGKKGSVL
jgi:hypothetical protein